MREVGDVFIVVVFDAVEGDTRVVLLLQKELCDASIRESVEGLGSVLFTRRTVLEVPDDKNCNILILRLETLDLRLELALELESEVFRLGTIFIGVRTPLLDAIDGENSKSSTADCKDDCNQSTVETYTRLFDPEPAKRCGPDQNDAMSCKRSLVAIGAPYLSSLPFTIS
jgi:hypothetical protein